MKKEALYWQKMEDGNVLCLLCPRHCKLREGQHGACFVRSAEKGRLIANTYGSSGGFAVDPIEKKPLYHFLPGTSVLSFGAIGCNLRCLFCQNWTISRSENLDELLTNVPPEEVVRMAKKMGCPSVAFTYNEPIIAFEYVVDCARACRKNGIKTVAVTAGYIEPEPGKEFFAVMDAANVDLKGFTEEFYNRLCGVKLQPILDTIKLIKKQTKTWLELTTLLIPGENDSEEEVDRLSKWIITELGPDVPLHFSAFHPDYKMDDHQPTPVSTLTMARKVALANGLRYVYTGNVRDVVGGTTFCPACKKPVIERDGFYVTGNLVKNGHCSQCHAPIAGVFG